MRDTSVWEEERKKPKDPRLSMGGRVVYRGREGYFYYPDELNEKLSREEWQIRCRNWGFVLYSDSPIDEQVRIIRQCRTQDDYRNNYGDKYQYGTPNVKDLTAFMEYRTRIPPRGFGEGTARRGRRHRFTLPSPLVYLTEEDDPCG